MKDVSQATQEIKLRCAEHVVRLDLNRWAHVATIWVHGTDKKTPGRPTTSSTNHMKK